MARREIQVFNMSFLDLMTDALGAVMILFLITPKGQSFMGHVAGVKPQGTVQLDTVSHKIHGPFLDSIRHNIGDTVAVVIGGHSPYPRVETGLGDGNGKVVTSGDFLKPNETIIDKNELERLRKCCISGDPIPPDMKWVHKDARILQPNEQILRPDQVALPKGPKWQVLPDGMVACEAAKCNNSSSTNCDKRTRAICLGKASFQISWGDAADNLDIFVKNLDNGHEVSYRKRKDMKYVGEMAPLKDLLGDGVKNTEIIFQEEIIPGKYEIAAMFYRSSPKSTTRGASNIEIFTAVSTRSDGKVFGSKYIPTNKQRTVIGTVTIDKDGSVH